MKKTVLLVKPNSIADEIIPPLSLGWLATQIRDVCNVIILDALKEGLDADGIARQTVLLSADVVGFQAWSKDIHEIKKICGAIKAVRPSVVTIVGGVHPTMMPEATLQFCGNSVDFAYQGEGEIGFRKFLDFYSAGNISPDVLSTVQGLVWRDGDLIKANQNCFIEDLDALGFPAWDLMPPASYPRAPHGAFFKRFPIAPIVVTRGCPFPCTFCGGSVASGKKIRSRSVGHVIEEIELLKEQFGVREFQIEDDNFTFNRKFVEDFCESLLVKALDMTWSFPNGIRLDTVDKELLALMKKAGCYALNFGVESGSDRILKMIKKKISTEDIRKQLTLAHEAGYDIGGFFIIGFPSETEDEIEETIRFACSLPLDRVGASYFQPFPGTAISNELIQKGEIPDDWAHRHHTSLHDLTYIPGTLNEEKMRYLRRKFLRSFYLRPQTVAGMMKQVRSPAHLYFMAKRAFRWLKG